MSLPLDIVFVLSLLLYILFTVSSRLILHFSVFYYRCRLTCDASTEPSECSGQCTNVCCTLNGDFDPWSDSNGILCPDGSPAPADGACPKLTPTLQPTPMLDDDCDTADETTCRDMCLDACAPETTTEECLDDCSNACCDEEDARKGDPWTSGQLCPDGSAPKRNLVSGDLRCAESGILDRSDQPTIEFVLNTPIPTQEPTSVPTGPDTPPPSRRPTPRPTPKPSLALQDACDVQSGEKWCESTHECYKEWQTICPTSVPCSRDDDCIIRIGGCGPYACKCTLLGINDAPPVECDPEQNEPCACADCVEGTCDNVRAVCIEGVCGKEEIELPDTNGEPTSSPTDPKEEPEDAGEDLILSEGDSMKLEIDFSMAWVIASPDADEAILDELPLLPGKFELWMNSKKGKRQIVRKFERNLDLIIEEVSDLTPRGVEDEQ